MVAAAAAGHQSARQTEIATSRTSPGASDQRISCQPDHWTSMRRLEIATSTDAPSPEPASGEPSVVSAFVMLRFTQHDSAHFLSLTADG